MRKILFILVFSVASTVSVMAEFRFINTEFASEPADKNSGVDSIFVVKGNENIKMCYNATKSFAFVWKSFDLGGNVEVLKEEEEPVSFTELDLSGVTASGYILEFSKDSAQIVWVYNSSDFKPEITSVSVDSTNFDYCEFITLLIDTKIKPMEYNIPNGLSFNVKQQYKLTYDSTYYSDKNYITEQKSYFFNAQEAFIFPSPLGSTTFTVEGNQFTMQLGDTVRAVSEKFEPVAVASHIFTSVRIREYADNELDKGDPSESKEDVYQHKGSAPLNFEALNYSSEGAFHYMWTVSTDKQFKSIMFKSFDRDFRYTFNDKGTYYVKVEVSNATVSEDYKLGCTQVKEYQIDVLESKLEVPNVFTPNGDGKNDLFKVAYKSIVKFHGWIYNQWGRLVYEWTDPALGWDGTINGKDAPDGAYMYIIEATGDDKDEQTGKQITYLRKGSVSIVR